MHEMESGDECSLLLKALEALEPKLLLLRPVK